VVVHDAELTADAPTSHVYVIGEVRGTTGPVKIGITGGRQSKAGRPGISAGNWRELEVLHRWHVAPDELVWTEWLIHRRLRPLHVRGEWFRVRPLAHRLGGWRPFLKAAFAGALPDGLQWRLGDDQHELASMRKTNVGQPPQFEATCSCGEVLAGEPGRRIPRVAQQFAITHLGLRPRDEVVLELGRRWP
jgi:hypothetical protein